MNLRRRALGCAVAAVCASCGPTHRAPPPTSTAASVPAPASPSKDPLRVVDPAFHVITRVSAFDADAADGRVFALDPEVRVLRGLDLATGKELWSTPLGVAPSGRVKIYPSYGVAKRVLIHVQNQLLLFDPQTGALATKTSGPWNQEKTHLSVARGACSFGTDCDLHLVDCEDARPYGPVLRSAVTHLYQSLSKPHDNVCWGPRLLVGRGGSVVVAITDGLTFELPDTPKAEGPITVGIDAKSGKTLWSTRSIGCHHCASSGISADGSTCWLAGRDGRLDVFACATGQRRFEKKLPEKALAATEPILFTTWVASGVFLSTATEALVLDAKTGAKIWSTALPERGLALPLATPLDLDRYSSWAARTVVLLDPKSGKEAARFELPAYTELLQSNDLGVRVKDGPAFDAKGQKRTVDAERPPFVLVRERLPRLLRTGDGTMTLAEVTTDLAIVAARRSAEGDEVALFVWGPPDKPGELVFARLGVEKH